jgi:hypothetical protein
LLFNPLILPKSSLKLISSKWSRCLLCVVFQQTIAIHMGTNYAHLLVILHFYSHKAGFIQGFWRKTKSPPRSFNSGARNKDDVFSLNNSKFGDFVNRIYPIELEIKHTTKTASSVSYLDLLLEFDNECLLRTKPYDKNELSTYM